MRKGLLSLLCVWLTSCSFHLQGELPLTPPLQTMYLQTPDPYGTLSRQLQQSLKLSHVRLVDQAALAKTVLVIAQDTTSQDLLSVSGSQQTRQYNLNVVVTFEVTDPTGRILVPTQTMSESRSITIQSNQILGSSNEANLYYQQMRRALAYAIMNRLASQEVTKMIQRELAAPPLKKNKKS